MPNKPHLYILCGLPFAGKTTLAAWLTTRYKGVRVDLNEINIERGLGGKTNDQITEDEWNTTYEISYDDIDQGLAAGKVVFNDTANFTKKQRDMLRVIAKKYDAATHVIYVNVPLETVKSRWLTNRQTKARPDVCDADFNEVVDHFEEPTADEGVLVYDHTLSPEAWAKDVFRPTLE